MEPQTIEQRLELIRKFGVANSEPTPIPSSTTTRAFVDGRSILLVQGDVRAEVENAIKKTTLLAQYAANSGAATEDPEKWYRIYQNALSQTGWRVANSFELVQQDTSSHHWVDYFVGTLAEDHLTGRENKCLQTFSQSLRSPLNRKAYQVFDMASKSITSANFQVLAASEVQGLPVLKIGTYAYTAHRPIDSTYYFTFDERIEESKIDFYSGDQTIVLDLDIWEQVKIGVEHEVEKQLNQIVEVNLLTR